MSLQTMRYYFIYYSVQQLSLFRILVKKPYLRNDLRQEIGILHINYNMQTSRRCRLLKRAVFEKSKMAAIANFVKKNHVLIPGTVRDNNANRSSYAVKGRRSNTRAIAFKLL